LMTSTILSVRASAIMAALDLMSMMAEMKK